MPLLLRVAAAVIIALLTSNAVVASASYSDVRSALAALSVQEYRAANEQAILEELTRFLAIPNLASDGENIEKNAQAIVAMFSRRGIDARLLRVAGAPPMVVAEVRAPRAAKTIAFYAHYDGQPVDAAQWSSPPWQPVVRDGRIYARSASDDKAPIMALLAALDAIRAAKIDPSVNLKFVFEGEEEAGSPNLATYLDKYSTELAADAWILCDGPVHQSGRPLVYYGARGVVGVEMTVYGPSRVLHSGHYGNWVPNPIVTLTHLIDSMRDTEARILIDGYYDDVVPVAPAERAALANAPPFDDHIRKSLAIGRTEGGATLNEQILKPALNLRGISGGHVGDKASNSIPAVAQASIDFRLVPSQKPDRVRELVERHVAKQGFFIVRDMPDAATRLAHPNVIRMEWGPGYPAARTAMELPISKRVAELVSPQAVLLPSLGGSVPMYLFQGGGQAGVPVVHVPVIGVPIVNHDNNQHAANENLRLQNLWDGIEIFARLFSGL